MRLKIGKKLKTASHNSKFTDSYQTRVNTLFTYYFIVDCSRVARISQRGGGFFGSLIQPKTNLTQIFISLKLDSDGFSPKIRLSPNKKGLHRNSKVFFGRNQKFKVFFQPNTGDLQTKKKGLHRNSKGFSGRNQKFKDLFPTEIRNSRVFFGRMQVISKKKNVSTEIQTGFSGRNQKFKVFFWPNAGDLQQKKVFPEIQTVFLAEIR